MRLLLLLLSSTLAADPIYPPNVPCPEHEVTPILLLPFRSSEPAELQSEMIMECKRLLTSFNLLWNTLVSNPVKIANSFDTTLTDKRMMLAMEMNKVDSLISMQEAIITAIVYKSATPVQIYEGLEWVAEHWTQFAFTDTLYQGEVSLCSLLNTPCRYKSPKSLLSLIVHFMNATQHLDGYNKEVAGRRKKIAAKMVNRSMLGRRCERILFIILQLLFKFGNLAGFPIRSESSLLTGPLAIPAYLHRLKQGSVSLLAQSNAMNGDLEIFTKFVQFVKLEIPLAFREGRLPRHPLTLLAVAASVRDVSAYSDPIKSYIAGIMADLVAHKVVYAKPALTEADFEEKTKARKKPTALKSKPKAFDYSDDEDEKEEKETEMQKEPKQEVDMQVENWKPSVHQSFQADLLLAQYCRTFIFEPAIKSCPECHELSLKEILESKTLDQEFRRQDISPELVNACQQIIDRRNEIVHGAGILSLAPPRAELPSFVASSHREDVKNVLAYYPSDIKHTPIDKEAVEVVGFPRNRTIQQSCAILAVSYLCELYNNSSMSISCAKVRSLRFKHAHPFIGRGQAKSLFKLIYNLEI